MDNKYSSLETNLPLGIIAQTHALWL